MAVENDYVFSPREKEVMEPILKYMTPERVENLKEIVINQPGRIGFENYAGEWSFVEDPVLDFETLLNVLRLLAAKTGQKYDTLNPIVSIRFPGGHRAQFVAGKQNDRKFSMSLRLHKERPLTIDDFVFPEEDKIAVIDAVKRRKTLLISGGTGSGKTTFMNALIQYIPDDERLITLEDVRELRVPHENWVPFVFGEFTKADGTSSGGVTDLLNACLRMRPDRILLGEIRKENAFTFCSAINTGHAGSMATIHANDPKSALDAVINRVMLNGDTTETAINILRRQLKTDIYGVVQLERQKNKVVGYFEVLVDSESKMEQIAKQELEKKAAKDASSDES